MIFNEHSQARQHEYTSYTWWLKKAKTPMRTSAASFWMHYNSKCKSATPVKSYEIRKWSTL